MTPPQKIKQWLTGQDGLDKLRMDEAECPAPGEDEVLVEVHSVSLNYRDTEGMYTVIRSCQLQRQGYDGHKNNAKNVDSRYGPLQPPPVGRSSSRDCSSQ